VSSLILAHVFHALEKLLTLESDSRLGEDGTKSVAVIEAGGFYEQDNGNVSVVPAYAGRYAATDPEANMSPLVDWGFVTEAQQGLGGRKVHYARGKTLGGR
jgi:choline dehydrogenase